MSVNLLTTLSQPLKSVAKFVSYQEKAGGLSVGRFIQDTGANWVPKVTFARSKADLAENTFLEFGESALVYFAPALVGQGIARKIFSRGLNDGVKKLVSKPAVELLKDAGKNLETAAAVKKVMPVKAAIALTALAIPLTEFCLNYFKNLFTLKAFKKSNFNNIAALENKEEGAEEQKKVEKSAMKNILRAAAVFAGSLALAGLMVKKGENSRVLQSVSEFILAPGNKLCKSEKGRNFFNKYFSLDFSQQIVKKGGKEIDKLVLSKGQLTSCVLLGGLGYFGAAKDRGKQNLLEVAFRFPLVGLYVITGSELFEKGFKGILNKTGKCKELLSAPAKMQSVEKLGELAKSLAKDESAQKAMYEKLMRQKAAVFGVPFIFSIAVMGFFVAGISNLFTKYRFKKDAETMKPKPQNQIKGEDAASLKAYSLIESKLEEAYFSYANFLKHK